MLHLKEFALATKFQAVAVQPQARGLAATNQKVVSLREFFLKMLVKHLVFFAKFKEHLKSATKIALLILIRVFFQKLAFCTCLLTQAN